MLRKDLVLTLDRQSNQVDGSMIKPTRVLGKDVVDYARGNSANDD